MFNHDKYGRWKYLKLAVGIHPKRKAFGYVLIILADHADEKGVCFPPYETLMDRTGITSKNTISDALAYWKDAGVLTWQRGWANAHGSRANTYQLNADAMQAMIDLQNPKEVIPFLKEVIPFLEGGDSSVELPKVSCTQGLISTRTHLPKEPHPPSSTVDRYGQNQSSGKTTHEEVSTTIGISSVSTTIGISSTTSIPAPTLAELKAKYAHASAHGGLSERDYYALASQIAAIEATR